MLVLGAMNDLPSLPALQLIETYLRYQLSGNPRFSAAVIIDYGETVGSRSCGRHSDSRRDSLPLTWV